MLRQQRWAPVRLGRSAPKAERLCPQENRCEHKSPLGSLRPFVGTVPPDARRTGIYPYRPPSPIGVKAPLTGLHTGSQPGTTTVNKYYDMLPYPKTGTGLRADTDKEFLTLSIWRGMDTSYHPDTLHPRYK